jgi:hypothetical protein
MRDRKTENAPVNGVRTCTESRGVVAGSDSIISFTFLVRDFLDLRRETKTRARVSRMRITTPTTAPAITVAFDLWEGKGVEVAVVAAVEGMVVVGAVDAIGEVMILVGVAVMTARFGL